MICVRIIWIICIWIIFLRVYSFADIILLVNNFLLNWKIVFFLFFVKLNILNILLIVIFEVRENDNIFSLIFIIISNYFHVILNTLSIVHCNWIIILMATLRTLITHVCNTNVLSTILHGRTKLLSDYISKTVCMRNVFRLECWHSRFPVSIYAIPRCNYEPESGDMHSGRNSDTTARHTRGAIFL